MRIDGTKIGLEVSPAFTPRWVYAKMEPGLVGVSRAPEPDEQSFLGSIAASPSLVTVWGAQTTERHSIGWPFPGSQQPESHTLRADWCIVGAHLPDPDVRFFGVRPEISNLTAWASMPSMYESHTLGTTQWTWTFDPPDNLDARLGTSDGYLTLGPGLSWNLGTLEGVNITTRSELEVELLDGWPLLACFERLTNPLATLMTLLSGTPSRLRSLAVWTDDYRWSTVHGHHVEPDAPTSCGELLLTREDTGLDFITEWLKVHERVSPVPQILAAVLCDELPTVEAEAISLVTAIEALHRTLFSDARRFTQQDIEASISALAESQMPEAIRKSFEDALRTWWPEYSYPMRVRTLAEPVAAAVPACVGRLNRWKAAVADQRVNLAHGLRSNGLTSDELLRMHSLNLSIRWMVLFRMLLEARVPGDVLLRAATTSEAFRRDQAAWRKHWPRIF